jgi:hypothetical protein
MEQTGWEETRQICTLASPEISMGLKVIYFLVVKNDEG